MLWSERNNWICHSITTHHDSLLAIVWNSATWTFVLEQYDQEQNAWLPLREIFNSPDVNKASITSREGIIYMTGGIDRRGKATRTAFSCDIESGVCEKLPDMPSKRFSCSSVATSGHLYVAGGKTKGLGRNDFEVLNISEGVWTKLPPTRNPLCGLGQVVGVPIAVGGRCGSGRKKKGVCDVEVFDSCTGQWIPVPPVAIPRQRPSVCVTERGVVIVAGGCSKEVDIDAVEILDLGLIGRL